MKKILFSVLIVLLIFSISLPLAYAKEEKESDSGFLKKMAIGVNPAILEVVVSESSVVKKISLYNLTNFPLPIKTLRESFSPREKLEIPKNKLDLFDASSWINLSEKDKDFILQPKETREISFNIISPKKASPGGHYASLIFQPMIPQEIVSRESVFVFARVAVLLFIQKSGEVQENLSIDNFQVAPFFQSFPIDLNLSLKNSGNTHIRPNGRFVVFDEIRKKTVLTIGAPQTIILPGSKKNFDVSLSEENAPKFIFGKYSVFAEVMYGANGEIIKSSKKHFIYFPWLNAGIIAFVVLFLSIFILILRKRIKKALTVIVFGEKHLRKKYASEFKKMKIKKIT